MPTISLSISGSTVVTLTDDSHTLNDADLVGFLTSGAGHWWHDKRTISPGYSLKVREPVIAATAGQGCNPWLFSPGQQ
jgi:hypothetical protein